MSNLTSAISFARQLYGMRAQVWYAGHIKRDPMALLVLGPGRDDPYPIYERLRAEGPMVPTRLTNWVTTSHSICDRVLRDRRLGVRPADDEATPTRVNDEQFDLSFLDRNPPDHTRLRRLAAPAFSPKQMAGYRPRIEKTVHALLDAALERHADGEFDLIESFAAALPIAVITDLLGIPAARSEAFARYGTVIGSALDGVRSLRHARELMAADAALRQLFEGLFELRRQEPTDDVVSRIVATEGDQIQPAEMVPMCTLLLIAGFETTVNLIGNGTLALLAHPDQWARLCADPSLAAQAVEEVLRFDPPVQRTARVALEATEIAGKPVTKGQFIVTLLGAANRDPEVYRDPAVFDIGRVLPVEHLAFSSGIHYCLGQPLARLEGAIAFQALAERLPGLRRGGRVTRRISTTIRGPLQLPVAAS